MTICHDLRTSDRASTTWLTSGQLFAETEWFIIAIQDRIIVTKIYKKYFQKQTIKDRCRMSKQRKEIIKHLISRCQTLAQFEYTNRNNLIANLIRRKLAIRYSFKEDEEKYFRYIHQPS